MRAVKVLLGAVILGGVLLGANAAPGAGAPMTGGAIELWITPTTSGGTGHVLVTGVVGDYGKSENATAAGKLISNKSPYKDLILKHGTILINLTEYSNAENEAKPTMFNTANCSSYLTVSAAAQIMSGTGSYKGITGTLALSADTAVLLPKTKKGACNENANPLDGYLSVSGTGTVKFG
jgi:hypothetical protein